MRPYKETFIVEKLSDGQFVAPGPYYGGRDMDMGPSACLRIGDVRVVVSSHKAQLADQSMYRYVGIEPTEQSILVNKSSVHFRADFEPIAEKLLICAAPGAMPADTAASAVDAVASGHSHQAERARLCSPDQVTFNFRNRITDMPNIDRIEGYADELTAIRRDLHAHPEIGFRGSPHLRHRRRQADAMGHRGASRPRRHRRGRRTQGQRRGGKRIGLRADMDALPMEENTNLKWRSTVPGRLSRLRP